MKFRRPSTLAKLAPCGLFKTSKVNELLSVAVTLTKTISPRLASIIVGTKINLGGKLAVESEQKEKVQLYVYVNYNVCNNEAKRGCFTFKKS